MPLKETLIILGLNDNEIAVYLALLPLGTVPASVLGTRVGIPRSTAKYTCQQLEKKGVITKSSKNNTELYTAVDPDSLFVILEKERNTIDKKHDALSRIMGDLKTLYRSDVALPKVQFFEGTAGIIKLLDDVLVSNQPLYGCLYLGHEAPHDLNSYFHDVYIPRRKRLRFPTWSLFNDNNQTRDYQAHDFDMNRISLLVPEKEYSFDICFHIYGEKIAFYSYQSASLVGVLIQDTFIKKMQFSLFKLAWNFARSLPINAQYKNVELA